MSTPGVQDVVRLPGDVVGERPMAALRRAVGQQDQHFQEPLGIGGPVGEIVVAREELARRLIPVRVAKVARAVHHQAGIGRDLAHDGW